MKFVMADIPDILPFFSTCKNFRYAKYHVQYVNCI